MAPLHGITAGSRVGRADAQSAAQTGASAPYLCPTPGRSAGRAFAVTSERGTVRAVSDEDNRRCVFRYRLRDGSEKVGHGWTSQTFSLGQLLMYPMRDDGASGTGWRYFWRVDAMEKSHDPAFEDEIVFEYERPDPSMPEPRS
jgi:hypothetical protein